VFLMLVSVLKRALIGNNYSTQVADVEVENQEKKVSHLCLGYGKGFHSHSKQQASANIILRAQVFSLFFLARSKPVLEIYKEQTLKQRT
jgi:hypothetical protein